MADKKISALTGATTPLDGTEVLPIVQGSATVKVSVANLTAGRAVAMAGGLFTDNITQSTAAKGVNFTANTPAVGMTSQLLNWYEEGQYTATITPSTSGTVTLTSNTLTYTRIGRQVTVTGYLSVASVASPLGYFSINLPFTSASGVKFDSAALLMLNGTVSVSVTDFWAQIGAGGATILVGVGGGTNVGATAAQELKAGTDMRISATYFVA